jgi:predicted transposase YbfD/YdcC
MTDLKAIAEWVENQEDAEILKDCGIDLMQGNLFGEDSLTLPWSRKNDLSFGVIDTPDQLTVAKPETKTIITDVAAPPHEDVLTAPENAEMEEGLALGQVATEDKSNEITAIPLLLEQIDLTDTLVTIDAMGTQTEIARAIVGQGADYVLAVKENQGHLYDDVVATFQDAEQRQFEHVPHTYAQTINKGHGRVEIRECWVIERLDYVEALRTAEAWAELRSLIMIKAERRLGAQTNVERRYYISSRPDPAERADVLRRRIALVQLPAVLRVADGETAHHPVAHGLGVVGIADLELRCHRLLPLVRVQRHGRRCRNASTPSL